MLKRLKKDSNEKKFTPNSYSAPNQRKPRKSRAIASESELKFNLSKASIKKERSRSTTTSISQDFSESESNDSVFNKWPKEHNSTKNQLTDSVLKTINDLSERKGPLKCCPKINFDENSFKSEFEPKVFQNNEFDKNCIQSEEKPKEIQNNNFDINTIKLLTQTLIPDKEVDEEVMELLLEIGDDFIDKTIEFAAKLAKHRKGSAIDVNDIGLALDRRWNMQVSNLGAGIPKTETEDKDHRSLPKPNFL